MTEQPTVIVTGAARGLGAAHVRCLTDLGTHVVAADLPPRPGEQDPLAVLAEETGAVPVHGDITVQEDVDALIRAAVDNFGGLESLICNAGVHRILPLQETTLATWDLMMNVHLRGVFLPVRAALDWWTAHPARTGSGFPERSIVCTTSQSGLFGGASTVAYDTMKAGVAAFVRSAANDLGTLGIRINGIAPRGITQMSDSVLDHFRDIGLVDEDATVEDVFCTADGRPLRIEDCAPLAAWLLGDDAQHVTGQIFEIATGELSALDGWSRRATLTTDGTWSAGDDQHDGETTSLADAVASVLAGQGDDVP